jgi:hypothetical protein
MKIRTLVPVLSLVILAMGCGEAVKRPSDTPIIRKSNQSLVNPEKCFSKISECISPAYEAILTLDKAIILGREFSYNLDIQYSSLGDGGDGEFKPYNASSVAGSIPVQFRIKGNSLELIKDAQPENLIGQFPIVKMDDKTITVLGFNSASYLATQVAAIEGKTKESSFLDHWLSSFDFDPSAKLLLQETSLKLSDGKAIVKFIESIYPRDTHKSGEEENFVKHFRLLPIQHYHCAQ